MDSLAPFIVLKGQDINVSIFQIFFWAISFSHLEEN